MSSDEHVRIFEVTTKDLEGLPDSRGENVRSMLKTDHGIKVDSVRAVSYTHLTLPTKRIV